MKTKSRASFKYKRISHVLMQLMASHIQRIQHEYKYMSDHENVVV